MYVSHITLANFRNYLSLSLDLPPGLVLLEGDNAQGKSNFLEALYFLATSRSPRTTREGELIAWRLPEGEPPLARLAARVQRSPDPVTIEIFLMAKPEASRGSEPENDSPVSMTAGSQKRIRVNGVPRRAVDLLGALRVVLFRPEDVDFVTGPPAGRRRALDILLSQLDPHYTRALQRYSRVLLQRNHLLRRIGEGAAAPDELTPWDEALVREGTTVLARRLGSLERLSPLVEVCHEFLSGTREKLGLSYVGTVPGEHGHPDEDTAALAAAFRERLLAQRPRDIALGQTTLGPHRDDLSFLVNSAAIASYGSRGQQRTVALAWKLAEARYLREATGDDPVVLLDDVLSELDAHRRRRVLEALADYQQVFLTTTNAVLTDPALRPAARFLVREGQVIPASLGSS